MKFLGKLRKINTIQEVQIQHLTTHHDQLTVILRYCNSKGLSVEKNRFYKNVEYGAQELE